MKLSSSKITKFLILFVPSLKIFPKKFLIFFPKKTCSEKFYLSSQKNFSYFQKTELSYVSVKVYSEPWHIKNKKHI